MKSVPASAPLIASSLAAPPRPQLQIPNGGEQTVEIFWLKSETERLAIEMHGANLPLPRER